VSGSHWPGSKVDVYFIQLLTTTTIGNENLSSGSFTWEGNIPSSAVVGTATIKVCSEGTTICKTTTITVAL
jgi:hypothetical protein